MSSTSAGFSARLEDQCGEHGVNEFWREARLKLFSYAVAALSKFGIRAPFVARSLRFVGTPHRSFWMVCSSGHDRIGVTLERSRVRAERTSNLSETAKMGEGRK